MTMYAAYFDGEVVEWFRAVNDTDAIDKAKRWYGATVSVTRLDGVR